MSFSVRKVSTHKPKPKRNFPWKKFGECCALLLGPILYCVRAVKSRTEGEEKTAARRAVLRRIFGICIALLCVVAMLALLTRGLMALNLLNRDDVISIAAIEPPQDEYGFTNILLLGVGHDEHDGTDLTDTIMVASLDPHKTRSIVMLSLPRDMYFLRTARMGKGKLNSMYRDFKNYLWLERGVDKEEAAHQAITELGDEIGRILQMEIHHTVKVDFKGFVKAVDALGGIDVEVPYDIVDTEYPDGNYGYETFSIFEGPNTLDGATALKYVRSRHTTSDFGRSARQQQVLASMAQKAKDENIVTDPGKIMEFLTIMREHVLMTLSTRELVGLAELVQNIDRSRTVTMQLNDRNALYDHYIEPGGFLYTPPREEFDGKSVLLPVSIPEFPITWRQVRTLSHLLFKVRAAYIAKPNITILNAGAPEGSARRLSYELTRYGFPVDHIANAEVGELPSSHVYVQSSDIAAIGEFFSSVLGIPTDLLPENFPEEERNTIVIILGKTYSYSPLQNLVDVPTPKS